MTSSASKGFIVTVKIGMVSEDADPFPLDSLGCMKPAFSFPNPFELGAPSKFTPLPLPSAMAISSGMSKMVSLFVSLEKLEAVGIVFIGVRMISSFVAVVSKGLHSLSELCTIKNYFDCSVLLLFDLFEILTKGAEL